MSFSRVRYLRGYNAWNFWPFHLFKRRDVPSLTTLSIRVSTDHWPQQRHFRHRVSLGKNGLAVHSKLPIIGSTDALLPAIRMINRICAFLCLHNGLVEWLWWPRVGAYRAPDSAQPAILRE